MEIEGLTIRKSSCDDLDQLVELLHSLLDMEEDFEFDEAHTREGISMMCDHPERGFILVAEVKGQVIGMCTIQFVISTIEGGYTAWIEDMVVHESYRRKGIGTRLLQYMIEWSKDHDIRRLQLLADHDNMPALKFYEKTHWKNTKLICLHKKQSMFDP